MLYSFDQLPGSFQRKWITDLMYWGNPLTPALEALRAPLYLGQVPDRWDVVYLCVEAVVALVLGAWVFRRVDDRIAVEL